MGSNKQDAPSVPSSSSRSLSWSTAPIRCSGRPGPPRSAPPTPSVPLRALSPAGSRPIDSRCWTKTGKPPALSRSAPAALPQSSPRASRRGTRQRTQVRAGPVAVVEHRVPASQSVRIKVGRKNDAACVRFRLNPSRSGHDQAAWCQPERRSSSQPATAVRLVAAAPSRLVGTPATLGIGCGGSSTPAPRTSGATQNGAQ
jgi:hypothetical protein